MSRIRRLWPALLVVAGAGCNSFKPEVKINEASDMVEQRLGQRPIWNAPWDESPPDWSAAGVLKLDEAVGLALRNNRALRADLEMIGQADADLVQAGLMQNPVINFMVMFPAGGGRAMLRGNGLPMQPLQDLWLIPARKDVAASQLQTAVLRVADRAIETATAVKSAYVRLQYTQRAIELMGGNIELAEQSTRLVQARQVAGQITQVAVNLAHVRALRLHSELLALQAEQRSTRLELLALIGFAGASNQWLVEPIREIEDVLPVPADEPALVELGATQRLDLKSAEWSLQAAEHRITLMQREGWPDIALGFALERSPAARAPRDTVRAKLGNAAAQGVVDGLAGVQPMREAPTVTPFPTKLREVVYTLGPMIELELPIFDQNQAQVVKAVHEYNQKQAEYEARLQDATRDIRAALVKNQQALEQVQFYRSAIVPDVERTLELAQESFVAGQEGLTVYFEAQEDLIMTRLKILEFLRDYLLTRVELERAVGGRIDLPAATTQPAANEQGAQP